MTTALESNDMSLAMPLYSTSVLFGSIVAGSLYFDEASAMTNPFLFFVGALITAVGLVVLAREKEQRAGQRMKGNSETEMKDGREAGSLLNDEVERALPLS